MSIFSRFKAWLLREKPIVIADLKAIYEKLKPIAVEALHTTEGQIVSDVVGALAENTSLTPEQKAAQAFSEIKSQVTAAGIHLGDSEINLLRELAVAALKKFVPAEAPVSPAAPSA